MDMNIVFWIIGDIAGFIGFASCLWYGTLFLRNPKRLMRYDQPEPYVNPWRPTCASFLTADELRERKISIIIRRTALFFAYSFLLFIIGSGLNALLSWMPWYSAEGTALSTYISYSLAIVIVLGLMYELEVAATRQAQDMVYIETIEELLPALNTMTREARDLKSEDQIEYLISSRKKVIAVLKKYQVAGGEVLSLVENIDLLLDRHSLIERLGGIDKILSAAKTENGKQTEPVQ